MTPADQEFTVFVVDDEERVRRSVVNLLASYGITAQAFDSTAAYLSAEKPDMPACLLLDLQLPEVSGLEFQETVETDQHPPIIFISGHGDIPTSVRAIKHGAVDFLTKPLQPETLLAAIQAAIALDISRRQARQAAAILEERYRSLTPREQQVLPLIVSGLMNKQGAAELGISNITFQIHRGNIMRKMKAKSFADLVRAAADLRVPLSQPKDVAN
jgi:FixJ family two-component response regulator